jgi:hypothetical protein
MGRLRRQVGTRDAVEQQPKEWRETGVLKNISVRDLGKKL